MHAQIGHNEPPDDIALAREAMNALSRFLIDTPAIASPAAAHEANEFAGRVERTLKDLDAARHVKVDPLNQQVGAINAVYRAIRAPLEAALGELKTRLTSYVQAEQAKRQAEADRLAREAAEKDAAARAAEAAEREAIANAAVGETTDVGGLIEDADAAFEDYTAAQRAALIAQRDVPVRLRSVLGGRARTLRTSEVLHVTDAHAALDELGILDDIRDAIVKCARAYRKVHGRLPAGVVREEVRSM